MTNTSKTTPPSGQTNIVFFGTEDFSVITLKRLVETGFSIAAVVTKPDSRRGRGQKIAMPAVKTFAQAHEIPVLQPAKLSDIRQELQALTPVIGVLVSYGKIIPQSIIDIFTPGIVNVHPSLLPKYRGPSPIEAAIAGGDQETGVTIMQLSAEMDAGPLYAYSPLELTGRETQPELYATLGDLGATMLVTLLPRIIDGTAQPAPQDHEQATYCNLLTKQDAVLDPTQWTAAEAERRVRAYLSFPRVRYTLGTHTLIITKAHVARTASTPLDIVCRENTVLSIDELIAPNGKRMSAEAFLHGYGSTLSTESSK